MAKFKDRFAWPDREIGFSKRNLRVGTLWMDEWGAEGEVTISRAFDSIESPLTRADVLKDILGLVEREYDAAVEELYDYLHELKRENERPEDNQIN